MKKTKTLAFSNLIGSIIFIVFGIWAWMQLGGLREIKGSYVQPGTFPKIMIVGMEIFSISLFVQSIIKLMTLKDTDYLAKATSSLDFVHDRGVRNGLYVILLCIAFTACFELLGYVIASFIVSFIIMILLGKRCWGVMALLSFGVAFVMWLIFYKVLTVNIPMGPLTFIRNIVDMI